MSRLFFVEYMNNCEADGYVGAAKVTYVTKPIDKVILMGDDCKYYDFRNTTIH